MTQLPIHPSMRMYKRPVMFELYGQTPICFHFSSHGNHILGFSLFHITESGMMLDPGIDDGRLKQIDLTENAHRLKIIGVDLI